MHKLSLLAFIFLLSFNAQGQSFAQGMPHAREIQVPGLREKGGLLHFDKKGVAFLLNPNQLLRYDGHQWKKFQQRTATKAEKLTAIASHQDAIWVGTSQGALLKTTNDSLLPVSPPKGKGKITQLAAYKQRLFVAIQGAGLWMWDGKQLSQVAALKAENIQYLHPQNNRLLIATDEGLQALDIGKNNLPVHSTLSNEPLISAIHAIGDTLWMGFQSGGIARLVKNELVQFPLPDDDEVEKLLQVRDALWVADKSGHLWKFNPQNGQVERLHIQVGNKSGRILDLVTDKQQDVWISTTNGLFLVHPAWKLYELPFEAQVQAIGKLGNGNLVAGTDAGCIYLDAEKGWQSVSSNQVRLNVLSLEPDGTGGLWVGTFGQGLWRLDAVGKLQRLPQSGYNPNIFSIEPAEKANSWYLGTLGGIYLLESTGRSLQIVPYHHDQGPGQFYIFDLLRDKAGTLWIATDGKGIYGHQAGSFSSIIGDAPQSMRIVSSLATDPDGRLWASSPEGQISCLRPNGWQSFKVPFEESINILQPTHRGNLLLGSQNGLWLYELADSLLLQLDKMYGLPALAYNTNAIYREADQVWLGANSSLLVGELSWFDHPALPPVLLDLPTGLSGQPLSQAKQLAAGSNNLRFQFQIPWYYQADMLYVRYKLHGLHTAWVETEKREIFLQGLAPGKYELEVQASLDPAFGQISVARRSFEISKPFYASWWFITGVAVSLILALRQFLRWREQKRRLQDQAEKEKIRAQYEILKSQISPHFLFNAFNTLSQLIDIDTVRAGKYVEQLALVFRKVLHFRDQDLITLRDEMSLVEAYIHLQQQRFENRLQVKVNIPESSYGCLVVPMSVQLLIENAVKHNVISATRPLEISLTVVDEKLTVRNKLQPKKQPEPSTGFGLSSLQNRYRKDLGQSLIIDQSNDQFAVTLPLFNPKP